MNIPYVYDTGALVAFDRNDRRMWLRHRLALEEDCEIRMPAVVAGQAWRDGPRQARLAQALTGCRVNPVGLETNKAAGTLCGRPATADVIDATIVVTAAALGAIIWTSDVPDIEALAAHSSARPPLVVRQV